MMIKHLLTLPSPTELGSDPSVAPPTPEYKEAATDRDTARSRHGYIINYAGCPLLWKSQLQTEVALSSTESEYTGLSYALRDAIPVMELLKEMKKRGYPILKMQARVHC